jgi:chromosome partitioning protein
VEEQPAEDDGLAESLTDDPDMTSEDAADSPVDTPVPDVEPGSTVPTAVADAAVAASEGPVASKETVPGATATVAPDPLPSPEEPAGKDEAVPVAAEVDPSTASPGRQAQAASGNPLPRVLAVANQKGGVGKTTTSVNLGAALAELGFRVLVIDLDPQGNATTGLGIDARNFELSMYDVLMRDCSLEDCVEPTSMKNLFVAPATIALAGAEIELVPAFSRELKLKRAIESVIDDFDYVLIDCPPSLGLITVNALAAATEVLVPIQCEYYALEGLSQLMRNVHLVASNLNPRLDISTIVLTMYDARTKLADQVATEVRDHFGTKVCRIVIPRTVRLSEAPSFGQPITAFDPSSRGAIAYRELAKEVSGGTS